MTTLLKFFQKKFLKIEKRLRFIISALSLSFLMLFSTFFFFDKVWFFIPFFAAVAYFFTYFALLEEIKGLEWLMLFLMPILLTVSFYLFYFLFPGRWLTRLPFILIYTISIYAILLTSNIFNVGVEKSLSLYRAAFSVNFFYQAVIAFLFFNLLASFKERFLINAVISGGVGFILSLQLFWSVRLKESLEKEIVSYAFLVAVAMSEVALAASFVPLKTTIFALFLTGTYYSLAGLIYNYIDQRLFSQTIREYGLVLGFVFLIVLLSISW